MKTFMEELNPSDLESTTFSAGVAYKHADSNLVLSAQKGDRTAFDELCRIHEPAILRVAQRITRNECDARDAVQDSLLRAYLALSGFDERASFKTWLTRITINSSLMILRKRQATHEVFLLNEHNEFLEEPRWQNTGRILDPEKIYLQFEREQRIRDSVRALRPTLGTAVQLRQIEEKSIHETATVLGISITAAKARLFRGMCELKRSAALRRIYQAELR